MVFQPPGKITFLCNFVFVLIEFIFIFYFYFITSFVRKSKKRKNGRTMKRKKLFSIQVSQEFVTISSISYFGGGVDVEIGTWEVSKLPDTYLMYFKK